MCTQSVSHIYSVSSITIVMIVHTSCGHITAKPGDHPKANPDPQVLVRLCHDYSILKILDSLTHSKEAVCLKAAPHQLFMGTVNRTQSDACV
jgi:hypothetical protein